VDFRRTAARLDPWTGEIRLPDGRPITPPPPAAPPIDSPAPYRRR
jgi:hypothetical protein